MECSQLNVLTRIRQNLFKKMLMLSIGLNLCAPTPVVAQCGNDFTTCRPTNASCGETTLTLLSATLGDPNECIQCPARGTVQLPMTLTIQNTGPAQSSVAIWALVTKTDRNGIVTTCRMSRCSNMPLTANGTSTVSIGNIQYNCADGDQLTLSNIVLASTTGTCTDLTACNTPCSRTTGPIAVRLPYFNNLSATATATQTCRGASDGSITVAVTGGTAPYTFTIAPGGTTNTTGVFSSLAANSYNIAVVDDHGCRVRVLGVVVSPKDLTVTCPPGNGGTYACVGDVPAANNSLIGISNNVQGCRVDITSADVRNNGTGCIGNPLIITRTYTITYGRTITNCVQTFTVIDDVAPVVTANTIASCYKTVAEAEAAAIAATTATDNCGNVTKTATTVGDCAATITVTGTDACGNNASVSYQTRIDNTAPTAANTDLGTLLTCNEALPLNTESFITATDNCPGRVAISAPSEWTALNAAQNCIVTYTRSYTITDACNNSATVIQTVRRKEDRTPPSFTAADLAQTLTCDQYKALTANFGRLRPTATDLCPGAVRVRYVLNNQTQLCATGSFTITWEATDDCGNQTTAIQTVTVTGYENPPTLTAGTIGTCYSTVALAEAAAIAATSIQESCSGGSTVTVSTDGTCSATIIVTATDACGHRASMTYQTRIDNTPPTLDQPNLGLLEGCNPALPETLTATDNCEGIVLISNLTAWVTLGASENCIQTYTRTCTVTDVCGNRASLTQTVQRKEDLVPPVFTSGDLTKTITCDEYKSLAADFGSLKPRATDGCPGDVIVTYVSNDKTQLCRNGSFTINWIATDACGNTATAIQTITVTGYQNPPTLTASTIGTCYPTVALAQAATIAATSIQESCSGGSTVTASTDGTCSATIVVTATDACGHTASVTYRTRIDNTPPTLDLPNVGLLEGCNPPLPETITATDNCNGNVVITNVTAWTPVNTDRNCIVTYTRTCVATDGCGNSASLTQTVQRKVDLTAPVFVNEDLIKRLTCAEFKALATDFSSLKPTATDGCPGNVRVTYVSNDQTQLCATGSFTIIWIAIDACGNESTTIQTIHVTDYTNPPVLIPGTIATCYPTAAAAEAAALAATTIQNNCVGVIRTIVSSEGTCNALVTVTVIDGCGRRVQVTYNTRIDNTPPIIGNTNLGNLGCNVALPAGNIITATDNCGLVQITQLSNWENPVTTNCVVTYTRRFIVADACGNRTPATQTVSRTEDNVDPVFETADLIKTLTCAQYQALEGNYSSLQPRVTDNCPGTITVTPRVNANAATTICNQRSFRINWSAVDACGNQVTAIQTVHINTPILAATVTVSCATTGGIITINATGGCGPYSYVLTYETGSSTAASSNTTWTNVINGNYTVTVTDANGCTVSRNVRVNCIAFCTMTQADFGNNARPNCPAVDALMATPITVGSGSRTLTLNTKECVVSLLPSTGTAAALSVSHTCSSCSSCANCECTNCGFPSNLTITDNRLLGHTLALALSLRKPENLNLGALHLNEICGLEIPSIPNVSGTTTVSNLLAILNQALGGNVTYSSSLNRLAVLTRDIIAAYDNCANPCATNPCVVAPATQILSEPVPVQPNLVKESLDFNVYPVPTSGIVQVSLEAYLTQDITITVYTLTSQVVQTQDVTALNQKSVTLDLGHLPDGTYLISVRGASQLPVSKVLIINK